MGLALAAWQVKNPYVQPRVGFIPAGTPLNSSTIARALRGENLRRSLRLR
jgi:hypothetical protein